MYWNILYCRLGRISTNALSHVISFDGVVQKPNIGFANLEGGHVDIFVDVFKFVLTFKNHL